MEIRRVFDILEYCKEKYSTSAVVLAGKEQGKWETYTILDYIKMANSFSLGLLALDFKKGDTIITLSNSRTEWNFLDMGMAQVGVAHVPVYPTISSDDTAFIIKHAQPKIIIVSDKQLYEKVKPICGDVKIYSINQIEGVPNWQEIISYGFEKESLYISELEKVKNSILPNDLFTIIYTSGTTGFPKGVMLSHSNLINNVKESAKAHTNGFGTKALSFLPLSHIYERMINYHYQYKGISIYYAENMGTIADNLREVKPQIFCTVPRVLELFFERIQGKGHDLSWIQRAIFFWSLKLGMRFEFERQYKFFYNLKLLIANKLIYSKVREALGGELNVVVSGGASLQSRLARVFWAAGVQVIEGYGLTETSPVIAVNNVTPPIQVMIGTVGPILPGVEVKIAEDGEILCRGHNVMLGYYKQDELTREAIDSEGWFHTGDIGTLEKGKFLRITDRKKEIFKLNSGKYIAPQVIENKLKESEFIDQAMVLGENQKFASALIQPNFQYLHCWCTNHKIHFDDNIDMISIPEVQNQYQKVINKINEKLGQTEQIKRIRLVSDVWSNQTGELSPTLKLKRKYITEKYKEVIDQIYLKG